MEVNWNTHAESGEGRCHAPGQGSEGSTPPDQLWGRARFGVAHSVHDCTITMSRVTTRLAVTAVARIDIAMETMTSPLVNEDKKQRTVSKHASCQSLRGRGVPELCCVTGTEL